MMTKCPYHGFSCPIKITIFDKAFPFKEILEKLSQIVVVWGLKEIQPPYIP